MKNALFMAERQYIFCQFCQRKFSGKNAGILYDYYLIHTDIPCSECSEEEMFEIISGYMLHLKFEKNPPETCFKMIPEQNGMWGFSFRLYRKMQIAVPKQETIAVSRLKSLFEKYLLCGRNTEKF